MNQDYVDTVSASCWPSRLMPFKHLSQLPALQWKLLNLRKLRSRNAGRFKAQHDELAALFKKLPLYRESLV